MINRDRLAKKILAELKKKSPQTYQLVIAEMPGANGMGAWQDALQNLLETTAQVGEGVLAYRQARDQQEIARRTAINVIEQERRDLEAMQLDLQRAAQTRATIEAEADLQRARNELAEIQAQVQFSGLQKAGLWIAGGLGGLLLFMVGRRRGII